MMMKLLIICVAILFISPSVFGADLIMDGSGNIGIGTESPAAKLDVNGNTNVTGDLTVSGAVNSSYLQRRVSGTCAVGSSVRSINADGTVECQADADSGGDITSVNPGTGLTGGGTAGDVTLDVNFAGTGTADTAARSDHVHVITPKTLTVDCDNSETISGVLSDAHDGDTIEVTGTCHESIELTVSGVTLMGTGSAVIDATGTGAVAAIKVDGAQRVLISDITVQNGTEGLIISRSTANLQRVTAQDNAYRNIWIRGGSNSQITDCTMLRANTGLLVDNAGATLRGTTVASENLNNGISVSSAGSLSAKDATVNVDNNSGDGINISKVSSASFSGGTTVSTSNNNASGITVNNNSVMTINETSSLTVTNNASDGIGIYNGSRVEVHNSASTTANGASGVGMTNNSSLLILGSGVLTSSGNEDYGIVVYTGSFMSVTDSASALVENNFNGIIVGEGSNLMATAGGVLTVQNNSNWGIFINAGSSLSLGGGSIIADNSSDMSINFGSRASLWGNTIGSIICDGSTLIVGDESCP